MSKTLQFQGRILFLTQDPMFIERQLSGEDLDLESIGELRDEVSTDEITPANICYYFDEKLGDYPYTGLRCENRLPIGRGAVRHGGFEVTVAGGRYGKGSSREASPFAEQSAGIRLVIAKSFERIYRQNCRNRGILTSTNFDLITRIRRGEYIALEEFTRDESEWNAQLIRSGGLFALSKARAQGWRPTDSADTTRPMTFTEKILTRASDKKHSVVTGESLFLRTDWRYTHDYITAMAATFLSQATNGQFTLKDPERILCFTDHLNFLHRSMPAEKKAIGVLDAAQYMQALQAQFCERHGVRHHGPLLDRDGAEGISHSIMAERYLLPGQVAAGSDSHTTHGGALGALCFGVGTTEIANAWLTGDVPIQVPKICSVQLTGRLKPGLSAKDIALHLLRTDFIKHGDGVGHVFEFSGSVIQSLSTDERATLTNMVAEMGGFTGIVVPDLETCRFLKERRGIEFTLEDWMSSDRDAPVAHTMQIDCSSIGAMLAAPGDPGNGQLADTLNPPVFIDIAYGGSCTGGKREDLQRTHEVLIWAQANGLRLANGIRFIVQFGSQDVRDWCEEQGMLATFQEFGIELLDPGCGACVNAGPGVSTRSSQVTVSSLNRNFPGRSGPGDMWLASPATVAASAIAGHIVNFEQLQRVHNA